MERSVRYQAAIIQDDHVLMLKVWDHAFSGKIFWVIPGGGRHPGESEEECVQREAHEETHLEVKVKALLLDEPDIPGGMYERAKTYLCEIDDGETKLGLEPEFDTEEARTIQAIGWFDLRDSNGWDALAENDLITLERLRGLQVALGYTQTK